MDTPLSIPNELFYMIVLQRIFLIFICSRILSGMMIRIICELFFQMKTVKKQIIIFPIFREISLSNTILPVVK